MKNRLTLESSRRTFSGIVSKATHDKPATVRRSGFFYARLFFLFACLRVCLLPRCFGPGFFYVWSLVMRCGYGLVHPEQLREYAEAVCDVLGHGAGGYAVDMLLETAAAETHSGRFRDPSPDGAGRGAYQVDPIAFDDVIARAPVGDFERIECEFGLDVRAFDHRSLDSSPLLATVVARLFYKRIPEAFPASITARAEYWKRFYNTALGAGTPEQYIEKAAQYKV